MTTEHALQVYLFTKASFNYLIANIFHKYIHTYYIVKNHVNGNEQYLFTTYLQIIINLHTISISGTGYCETVLCVPDLEN